MSRNALLASLLMLGLANCADAQDYGPRMVGGGEDSTVVYNTPSHNVVGGGYASLSGGADDMRLTYGRDVKVQPQTGLVATLVGGGDDRQLVYLPADQAATMFAGQPQRRGN